MRVEMDARLTTEITRNVAAALAEDIGAGDITGELIPADRIATATVTTRDAMTLAGRPWFDEACRQVDAAIEVTWQYKDGDRVAEGTVLCELRGPARSILTAERSALNFLQLLSATATVTRQYADAIAGTGCRVLDTRKTIPGLRLAQKYAVRCGGGTNHRLGLYDAFLIKENHILSAGGIAAAIEAARTSAPGKPVEIEVETFDELREALAAGAERLLLDNFTTGQLAEAVAINEREGDPPAELEASGDMRLDRVAEVAATGVDYISVGALTKHVRAIDLSMRFR
jgi:nicotinate-nucleotide pyrophosphorylase (carboxylating)